MVKSNLIIGGSNFIFEHINANYSEYLDPKNKLMVIFRGINLEYYNPDNISENKINKLKKLWKVRDDRIKILLPGRLTNWKGQEKFIEALNILIEDYNTENFQAFILGSDQGEMSIQKKLRDLVQRYNLNQKIFFIEHCNEMPTAYSIVDIVVSSSIEPEAFGRIAVEAQAMRKPIVDSNLGGSKETILDKKSGYLYNFNDPRELAKKP